MLSRALLRTLACGAATVTLGGAAACLGTDPTPADSNPVDASTTDSSSTIGTDAGDLPIADAGLATLSIAPELPRVEQGASVDVTVKVARTATLSGDLTIDLVGLPTDVTASPIVIPAGSSETTTKLTATAGAAMGIVPITLKTPGASDLSARLAVAGASGSLDTSFDNDGVVLDTSSPSAAAYAVTELPDGSIVVAGSSGSGWFVRHYDESGKPDAAFNAKAASVIPTTGIARVIALDPVTGRILVGGSSGSTEAATVVRLNADGSADQTFANAGTLVASTVTHPNGSRVNAMLVTAESKIIVAGQSVSPARAYYERYTATGASDDNAFAHYSDQNGSSFTTLLPLASGSYLATGTDLSVSPPAHLALRFSATGQPDTSFGATGRRSYADDGCSAAGAALAANGEAIIVGQSVFGPSYCETRIDASGDGTQRFSKTISGGNTERFNAAATGPGNTTYAAGQGGGSQDKSAIVIRRNADGTLDSTFAPTSATPGLLAFADPMTPDGYVYTFIALTPTRDGRLYIGGSRSKSSTGFVVFRIWQ